MYITHIRGHGRSVVGLREDVEEMIFEKGEEEWHRPDDVGRKSYKRSVCIEQ